MIPTYTFFAVDKGNMTLIQFPNGVSMVVDCRRSETRPSPLEYLKQKGLQRLDFLVITHPHRDHLSGIEEMCEALKPSTSGTNGRCFKPDPVYDDWLYYEKLRNGSSRTANLRACERARRPPSATPSSWCPHRAHRISKARRMTRTTTGIILSVTAEKSKVVLTGDTQHEQWDGVDLGPLSNPFHLPRQSPRAGEWIRRGGAGESWSRSTS